MRHCIISLQCIHLMQQETILGSCNTWYSTITVSVVRSPSQATATLRVATQNFDETDMKKNLQVKRKEATVTLRDPATDEEDLHDTVFY